MPFFNHNDRLRAEVIYNVGGVVSFWPRVDGAGNVEVDSATYSLQRPDGTVIATGNATLTEVGAITTAHRLDVAVSAGNAATLDEGYRCVFTWTAAAYSVTNRVDLVLWDVVRFPFTSNPMTSLTDLQALRPSIDERLERFGQMLGLVTDQEEQAAMVFAHQARAELYAWIKAAAATQGTTRPALVLDRKPLAQVEALLALALVFEADAAGPGSIDDGGADDEASSLARFYRGRADALWRSIQPLDYDSDEDGVADEQVRPGASAIVTVRGGWA